MFKSIQVFTIKIETTKRDCVFDAADIQDLIDGALGVQSRCTMVSEEVGNHKPTSKIIQK